jgi:ankyrin repeat protein
VTVVYYMHVQTDCTALTIATQAGHIDIVELLLEEGANLNVQEKVIHDSYHYW